ncbi:MAG TPA: hypothetical protein VE093_24950 [Polyangiaceae bacterium]|jgi:hypothetical protein|nr:hypothetical protein [Polyangiaceae bacterium]
MPPIEREGRARAVADEPLAPVVVGFDPNRRMEVEAIEVRDEAPYVPLGFEPAVAMVLSGGAPWIENPRSARGGCGCLIP